MKNMTLKMRKALVFMMIWVLVFTNMPMSDLMVNAQGSGSVTVTSSDSVTGEDSESDMDDNKFEFNSQESEETGVNIQRYEIEYPNSKPGTLGGIYPIPEHASGNSYTFIGDSANAACWGDSVYFGDCNLPCTITLERWANGNVQNYVQITVKPNESAAFEFEEEGPLKIEMENESWEYKISDLVKNEAEGGVQFSIVPNSLQGEIQVSNDKLIGNGEGSVILKAERVEDKNHYAAREDTLEIIISIKGQYRFEQDKYTTEYPLNGIYTIPQVIDGNTENITYEFVDGPEISNGTINVSGYQLPWENTLRAKKNSDVVAETIIRIETNQNYLFYFAPDKDKIIYEENCKYTLPELINESTEGVVEYSLDSDYEGFILDTEKRMLSIGGAKTVTVTASLTDDKNHFSAKVASFTLTVEKNAGRLKFVKGDETITSDKVIIDAEQDAEYEFHVNSDDSRAITYTSSNSDIAELVWETDGTVPKLKIKRPGNVTISAVQEENDNYNKTEATLELQIGYKQDALRFVDTLTEVTYNELPDNMLLLTTEGGSGSGAVTYAVINENEENPVATIGGDAGNELIIHRAGTVTVKAVKSGDDCYLNSEDATLEITITKAQQCIVFSKTEPAPFIYGSETTYTNIAKEVQNDEFKGCTNIDIIYQIVDGSEIADIIEDDDKVEGTLSFKDGQIGTITVKAIKPGNDSYEEASATYSLEVQYENVPEITYSLKKDKEGTISLDEENWFNHDVYIWAPEGYLISSSNALHGNEWCKFKLLRTVDGQESENSEAFYLKKEVGGITTRVETNPIKIDRKAPQIGTIFYRISDKDEVDGSETAYLKKPVTVSLQASDNSSGIDKFIYYVGEEKEGNGTTISPSESEENKEFIYSFELEPQFKGQVFLEVVDKAGNVASSEEVEGGIVLDDQPPVLTTEPCTGYKNALWAESLLEAEGYDTGNIDISKNKDINLYYNNENSEQDIIMAFWITEANMYTEEVLVCDSYLGEGEEGIIPPERLSWSNQEDTHLLIYNIPKDEEGEHVVTLKYQDRSGNAPIEYTTEKIIIDTTAPEISLTYKDGLPASKVVEGIAYYGANKKAEICINEENFRASDVGIEITTTDAVEEVDVDAYKTYLKNPANWEKTDEGYVAYVDFDIDACYDIRITYEDLASLVAEEYSASIVIDKQEPVEKPLEPEEAYDTNSEAFKRMVDENNSKVVVADANTRFIYQDAMTFKFAMEEINFNATDVEVSVYRDGNKVENDDGYYYAPDQNWSTDGTPYGHILTLDLGEKNGVLVDGDYKVVIAYTDRAGHPMECYTSNTITIDRTSPIIAVDYDNMDVNNDSYYNKDRVATITVTDRNVVAEEIAISVTAADIEGNAVPFDLDTKQSAWEFDKETNTWISNVTYDVDANYSFEIKYNDMADNEGIPYTNSFTVDKVAPSKDNFRFEYSTAFPSKDDSNNAFYKEKVIVRIIAEDVTSPIDYFEWTYIRQQGASSINQEREEHTIKNGDATFTYDATKRTATAEFTLTAEQAKQYRGNLRFKATDMAGNASEELEDAEKIVIVDTISPTRMVEYSSASQIVDKDTLYTVTGFDYTSENVGAILLYNVPMTVTFKVNEANFYENDIVIKVNDVETIVTNWSKDGDVWTGSIPISEDGEYIVTLQYTDRSTNEMVDYVSHGIIVDTIKPQVQVLYSPNDVKQQLEDIKYYETAQTATITIKEQNFRADDINVFVSATDVNGNDISVTDYAGYLRERSNWTSDGDTHTAKISFTTDANYEFDIQYTDLAMIPADDYPKDVFTVDQTAPTNVSISYSSPIFEKIIQGTAYEYYNEPIVVTITAEDNISGIYSFDYSYIRAEGVSSVNTESIANKIDMPRITYSNGKKTASATFVIPASELRNGTQINGSMKYVASNRSLKTTEYKDSKHYVVDNIAPNVEVEFNDCVQMSNNISYYAGAIDVTITVDEANFYTEDVKVSVSKDGGEQRLANILWRTVSVDKHVGYLTLEDEGDYRVYVSYQDPSANKADEYQSNQLTIDKTRPSVSVSGILHNSANNMDEIGFVVTVEDTNLDSESFSPKLIAEIRDASGLVKQVDCTEIGTVEIVVDGKSCIYKITNIEQDGIYHFECLVSDMSGNLTEDMVVTDSGNRMVSQLNYSVNRNGSTYGLDESTKKINNSFVKNANDIIIYETNPDEIDNIKVTLFKNDKAIELVEGKDYVVNKISKDNEWYKYEYIIYASNFIEDGTYRISVYSEDKAGNIAENNLDVKDVEINFGVDKTLPNLIITNLENKTTYPLDKHSVLMQATDNMKLVNIIVELDGKVVATWDEEQIQQMSSNLQDFVFDIMGDSTQSHTVTVMLTDIAGNESVETISDFYVTRNIWVRFTNNKLLFYGSIMTCLAVGFSFGPLWKRRKKRKMARG